MKPRDEAIVVALLATGSQREAAKRAGCGESTVRRKLDDPKFMERYDSARRRMFGLALGRLQRLASLAVETLNELLSKDQAPAIRLGAARAVLEYSTRWADYADIERRITVIESRGEEAKT